MSDEPGQDARSEHARSEDARLEDARSGDAETGREPGGEAPVEREPPQIPGVELPEVNRAPVPDRSNAAYLATTPGLEPPQAAESDPAADEAQEGARPLPKPARAFAESGRDDGPVVVEEPAPEERAAASPDAPARRRLATAALLIGVLAAAAAALMLVARGRGLPEQVQTWTALIAGLVAIAGGARSLRDRGGAGAAIATALGVLAILAVALRLVLR